jgi:aminopeptidase
MDNRWKQLGDLLVDYAMQVKAGEKVMIAMGELESYPVARVLYAACIKKGAFPQVQFLSEELNRLTMKYGNDAQIGWVPEIEAYGMEWADVYFGLRGAHNLNVHWDIPTHKLSLFREGMGKVSTLRWQKTRWSLLRIPNAALAEQANVDEETITDMFFNACLLDWNEEAKICQKWVESLNKGKLIRVVGKETDLSFSVDGRTWEYWGGRSGSFPAGEIATAPVCETVNGTIYFDFPGVLGGRLMHDMRLTWEHGKLVSATASTNEDYLQSIVNTDAGASQIGEFAFGTNKYVTHFCKDILLDEKIGGTIHIALGRAYPKEGGTNQSAIHWDIIKDMRQEGQVYLDGELIFEKGKMLL